MNEHIDIIPTEYFTFNGPNFKMELKHEVIVNEFEIKDEDTKIKVFEKEVKLKSKV